MNLWTYVRKLFQLPTRMPESRRPRHARRSALLGVESLEGRALPSAVSGYVFQDLNNNGLMDAGEPAIANVSVQLRNSANTVVGTATTDANGFYLFNTDATVDTSPKTESFSVAFPDIKTNTSQDQTLTQFDPSLGILQSVEIQITGDITSDIKAENLDDVPATLTGTVSGNVLLTGPQLNAMVTTAATTQTFSADAYDGTMDFGGASGRDFGFHTANGTSTITLTNPADLAAYIGTGTVNLTAMGQATSAVTGGGNFVAAISSQGGAQVKVIYHYSLDNSLKPGNYTISELSQPSNFLDGKDSSNGVVIPNSVGRDIIPVTLGNVDAQNNDFGELPPAGLAGFVWLDANNDGVKDPTEIGIANVWVRLTGVDDLGRHISVRMKTGADGSYNFGNLRPGTYTLTETPPLHFTAGQSILGSLGGDKSHAHQFASIPVGVGAMGTDYDFAEIVPVSGGGGGGGTGGSGGGPSGKGSFIRR